MAIGKRGEQGALARRTREWDPFQAMRELANWDPFQGTTPRLWRGGEESMAFSAAFDVRETKDGYLFTADLPGFRDEDIDINLSGNRLTITGKREAENVDEGDTYYCSERSYGSFTRSFTLPDDVRADQIHAEMKNGILSLRVPKAPEMQPKKIPLKKEQGKIPEGKA